MPILASFTNFCDFQKAVAIAFLGNSKFQTVNFEIHFFSFQLLKNFCLRPGKLNLG